VVLVAGRQDIEGLAHLAAVALLIESGREIEAAWNIPGVPFAVAIDPNGIVRSATFTSGAADVLNLCQTATWFAPIQASMPSR
jgi:hypothetical protein